MIKLVPTLGTVVQRAAGLIPAGKNTAARGPFHQGLWRGLPMVALLLLSSLALGHDGGFGHSRRTIFVTAGKGGLVLEYRIQHNRDDALVEVTLMDTDHDGNVSADEKDR